MRPQPEPRPSGRRGSPAPLSTLNPARTFPAQEAVDSSDNPYPPDQPTAACALDIRTRFHPASRTRAYCETRNSWGKPSNIVHAAYFVYAPDLIWDAGINPVPNLS